MNSPNLAVLHLGNWFQLLERRGESVRERPHRPWFEVRNLRVEIVGVNDCGQSLGNVKLFPDKGLVGDRAGSSIRQLVILPGGGMPSSR